MRADAHPDAVSASCRVSVTSMGPIAGTPYWVSLEDITQNDVLPNEVWEAVMDAIDAKCKVQDAERRTAAKGLDDAAGP